MSKVRDLYVKKTTGSLSSNTSSNVSRSFIVSVTLSGEGVYTTWKDMWDVVSQKEGPQLVYIHGEITIPSVITANQYDFKNNIEIKGLNNGMIKSTLLFGTNNTIVKCPKFTNINLVSNSIYSSPIFVEDQETMIFDDVSCSSNIAEYPVILVSENSELLLKIVNNDGNIGAYSIAVDKASLEIANYGLRNSLSDNWLVDIGDGLADSDVFITQYAPMSLSFNIPDWTKGLNLDPVVNYYGKAYMTFQAYFSTIGYARFNGDASSVPTSPSNPGTQGLCPVSGADIQELLYNTTSGTEAAEFELHINGEIVSTFTITEGMGSVTFGGINVERFDVIEIYYPVATVNCAESTFTVVIG
jgi:hypothetical protein